MDSYIVEFRDRSRNRVYDLQVPASITGNELVRALQKAYDLKLDPNDMRQLYLRSQDPVALITGNNSLEALGIRNGTSIFFDPR